jgi:DNA repair protein RadC
VAEIETLRVIHLGGQRRILDVAHYPGAATQVIMPLRRIVADALRLGSSALVLSHNHPSGDPTPSRGDVALTRQLANLLAALEIHLHDHVVIGGARRVSFREAGLL